MVTLSKMLEEKELLLKDDAVILTMKLYDLSGKRKLRHRSVTMVNLNTLARRMGKLKNMVLDFMHNGDVDGLPDLTKKIQRRFKEMFNDAEKPSVIFPLEALSGSADLGFTKFSEVQHGSFTLENPR